jgi:hypothetical protein
MQLKDKNINPQADRCAHDPVDQGHPSGLLKEAEQLHAQQVPAGGSHQIVKLV